MSKKSKDPDAALKATDAFKTFEQATKQILKVPKTSVDKKLADEKTRKRS